MQLCIRLFLSPAPVTFELKCYKLASFILWFKNDNLPLKQWMTYLVFRARRKILRVQVKKIREPSIGRAVRIGGRGTCENTEVILFFFFIYSEVIL